MMTYDVRVTREDDWWVAEVTGLRGGTTEVRTLLNLDVEVRDLVSGLLDVEPDSFDLKWHWEAAIGQEAAQALEEFCELRDQLEVTKSAYERAQREAVTDLRAAGLSVRDAARLLGVSFQRVQQLAGR